MRGFYEITAETPSDQPPENRVAKVVLALAVLVFWLPCAGIDLYIVWRGGGRDGVGGFVFGLLYRQSLVFLALWFAGALVHGLVVGRRTPAEPRRKRRREVAESLGEGRSAGVSLSRQHRGV